MTTTLDNPTTTTASVDVKSADLVRTLENVALFLAPVKDGRPVLTQTEITLSSEGLTFVATDSFALIRETLPVDVPESLRGRTCLLNLSDFLPILKVLKAGSKTAPITLTPIEDGRITVDGPGISFASAFLGSFPAWQNIMPKDLDGVKESAPIGIGLWQMVRLGKIKRDNDHKPNDHNIAARLQTLDPMKPMEFTIGSDITVIVMPVRLS